MSPEFGLKKDKKIINEVLGVKVGRSEHLTQSEYMQFRSSLNWPKVREVTTMQLSELQSPTVYKNFKPVQRDYVLLLAFLQRIRIPLNIRTKIVLQRFPSGELPNFQYFDDLFERNYQSLFPLDGDKQIQRANRKKTMLQAVAKLWVSGYALKDGLGGIEVVTNSVIEKAKNDLTPFKKSLDLVGKMLVKEPESSVRDERFVPFDKSETALWIEAEILPSRSQIEESIADFVFLHLACRVDEAIVEDHFDDEGNLKFRYGKKTISIVYWRAIAKYMRRFLICCKMCSITEISESSIIDAYTEVIEQMPGKENKTFFRVALKHWIKWHNRTQKINLNVERIMPRPKRAHSKLHGRVFSMARAHTLVQTLLDDHSPLINENDIMHFRYRRICLLLLATAARPSEILNLIQHALFQDSNGEYWIRFHKTKTKRNVPNRKSFDWVHYSPIKEDAVKWFNELLQFAPKERLHFPAEWGGDDLAELRLLAVRYNDAPILRSSLYAFLRRLQNKLWPEMVIPYFTPHNFRALHLTYRRILGDEDVILERQADHRSLSSKKPYVQTMPAEDVAKFGDILKKGVWEKKRVYEEAEMLDVTDNPSEGAISLNDLTKASSKLTVTPRKLEEVIKLTQQVMETSPLRFHGLVVNSNSESPIVPVGGFTHNCNAHVLLNCGHTPGHCRACEYYSPDEGTENIHQTEIFREMVHYYYCVRAEKDFKSTGQRKMVFQKADEIKERLEKSKSKLWVDKFNLKPAEVKKLYEQLWKKAKTYFRYYADIKPKPTNEEILQFISTGEMN
ncbi:site-specific integrase [uncultured Brevibacillus sp.]|uniref:site-specific integrase n=1 Tax=uncultured Brevibacillus sp. TaxID=169970 RepID=UPI0025926975|nr:site-specific integrase [uncultured Brevibacillus sp.]